MKELSNMRELNWIVQSRIGELDIIQDMSACDNVMIDHHRVTVRYTLLRGNTDDEILLVTMYSLNDIVEEKVASFEEGQKLAEAHRKEFWTSLINEIYRTVTFEGTTSEDDNQEEV